MKAHNWHAVGWIVWAVASVGFFAVWEYIGLLNREDNRQPLTYFIRKAVGTPNNPVFWVFAAMLLWFFYHILIVHDTLLVSLGGGK